MDQSILERIKGNIFGEELQSDPSQNVTAESDPKAKVDVPQPEELEAAVETEEHSDVELATETEDPEPESQEPERWSLEEVAESLEMSVDDLLNDWEIDVEGKKVRLADLKKGTLRESDYTKKTMALAEERRAFEETTKKKTEQLERDLSVVGNLIQMTESQLMSEYNAVDWKSLKEDDPNEFLIKQNEFQQRYHQLQGVKQNALQQYQAYKQSEQDKLVNEVAPKERNLLLDKIPEFKDSNKFDSGMQDISRYLSSLGYSGDELGKLVDHRTYVMAHKAMLYDQLKSRKPELERKAKSVPKVLKPKGRAPKEPEETKKQKDLRQRLRKTGKIDDLAALIRNSL